MSILPQLEEVRYRDSAKVLKDIQEAIARHVEKVTLNWEKAIGAQEPSGSIAADTLAEIVGVMDDAAKTTKIWAPRASEAYAMDPRDYRSS